MCATPSTNDTFDKRKTRRANTVLLTYVSKLHYNTAPIPKTYPCYVVSLCSEKFARFFFSSGNVIQLCLVFQFNFTWEYPCKHAEGFIRCRSICFCQFDIGQSLGSSDFCGVAFPLHAFYPYLGTLFSWNLLGHYRPVMGLIYNFTLLWAGISY